MKTVFLTIFLALLALVSGAAVDAPASKVSLEPRNNTQKGLIPVTLHDGRRCLYAYEDNRFVGRIEQDAIGKENFTLYGADGHAVSLESLQNRQWFPIPIPPWLKRFAKIIRDWGIRVLVSRYSS